CFFFQAEDGIRDPLVTGVQTCALPISAAVIIQTPNFFGIVEQVKAAAEIAHRKGALLVVVFTEAVSLGILEPPADADIVAGELRSEERRVGKECSSRWATGRTWRNRHR